MSAGNGRRKGARRTVDSSARKTDNTAISDGGRAGAGNYDYGTDEPDLRGPDVASILHAHHIVTLAYLLLRGARQNYVEITTTELGREIKKSQQSASRHLADLERDGLVERGPTTSGRRLSVRITRRGVREIQMLSDALRKSLDGDDDSPGGEVVLEGSLVSGMGEGAYYMALGGYTRQFGAKIGYVPFPGTLNIRLRRGGDREALRRLKSVRAGRVMKGFSDGRRTYGWVKCLPAVLDAGRGAATGRGRAKNANMGGGRGKKAVPCELIFLERTHHDDSIIELISEVCIRDAASITDGSSVAVRVLPDDAR